MAIYSILTMLIPAAGYGTRMRQITRGRSKELVEVGGRPAIMFAMSEALHAGLRRVGIIIRSGKEDIVRLVREDPRLVAVRSNLEIEFFMQERPTGEAGAIAAASQWLGGEPFVVHYPDNIVAQPAGITATLVDRYMELEEDVVLLTKAMDYAQVKPICLKPVRSGLYLFRPEMTNGFSYGFRPTGIYVVGKEFLKTCQKLMSEKQDGENKDWHVRYRMSKDNKNTYGIDMCAIVLDVGNPSGYAAACKALL